MLVTYDYGYNFTVYRKAATAAVCRYVAVAFYI